MPLSAFSAATEALATWFSAYAAASGSWQLSAGSSDDSFALADTSRGHLDRSRDGRPPHGSGLASAAAVAAGHSTSDGSPAASPTGEASRRPRFNMRK
ncbi:hypothetical protein PANT_12d00083 [Moesziomyces antarcticus T-34]|uniref:Uncharacterized protein n=1 Tax=Pseudozyma antarctica (strain T-34) TaxID=1151754 RepID=M9MFW0_PSEA3|nr:hypothetical protein PANT_12d00083 [Moesziomyces antarcticus T-34]